MSSALIVCTANVCRSPVAELLWRAAAAHRGVVSKAASVGLQARAGDSAHPVMVELLEGQGLDLSPHRATLFVRSMALQYDLILAMEPSHVRAIQARAPELSGRVQLMGRWSVGPISDPIGEPLASFERCVAQLARSVDDWLDKLSARRPGASIRSVGTP